MRDSGGRSARTGSHRRADLRSVLGALARAAPLRRDGSLGESADAAQPAAGRRRILGHHSTSCSGGASALALAWRWRVPAVGARAATPCTGSGWTSGASAATWPRPLLLAAVIGIPGLGLYALGRALLGLNVAVRASPLDAVVVDDPAAGAAGAAGRTHRGGHLHRVPLRPAAAARLVLVDDHPLDGRAARRVSRVSGLRRDRRQLGDGHRVRLVLPPLGPRDAAGDRPHAPRHRGLRRATRSPRRCGPDVFAPAAGPVATRRRPRPRRRGRRARTPACEPRHCRENRSSDRDSVRRRPFRPPDRFRRSRGIDGASPARSRTGRPSTASRQPGAVG